MIIYRFRRRYIEENNIKRFVPKEYYVWLENKLAEELVKKHFCFGCNKEIDKTVERIFGSKASKEKQ